MVCTPTLHSWLLRKAIASSLLSDCFTALLVASLIVSDAAKWQQQEPLSQPYASIDVAAFLAAGAAGEDGLYMTCL